MTPSFKLCPPPVAAFIGMRRAEGWGEISEETAHATLAGGLINITAYDENTLVGFGRIVGDGVLYFYIQDVIVAPPYRGNGYGREIIQRLISEVRQTAADGAVICLMAARGKEPFYESLGFTARPNHTLGAGMMLTL